MKIKRIQIIFEGKKFTQEDCGYYRATINDEDNKRLRLHQCIWIFYNGIIPKGFEIHHRDRDKDNNDINNLMLVKAGEHKSIHGKERIDWFLKEVIPKSQKLVIKECIMCGEEYPVVTVKKDSSKYCSKQCKAEAFLERKYKAEIY